MLGALSVLGVDVERVSQTEVVVKGCGGPLPVPPADNGEPLKLDLGNAGTGEIGLGAKDSWSEATAKLLYRLLT